MDLKKCALADFVKVGNELFKVKTSYKYWLTFLDMLEEGNHIYTDFDFVYDCEPPEDREEGLRALIRFANPESPLPRAEGGEAESKKVVDYDIDAPYIFAAFMEQYGIDLIEANDLHFHKFLALLQGLHDTKLSEIIGFRCYECKAKEKGEYEKFMLRMQSAWELPEKESADDDLRAFEALLGN